MFWHVKKIVNMEIRAMCTKPHTVPIYLLQYFVFPSWLLFSNRNIKVKAVEMNRVSKPFYVIVSFSTGINYYLLHLCAPLCIHLYYSWGVHVFAHN